MNSSYLSCFMVLAVLSEIRECESLNPEGLALLEFRERIENDPYGAFENWDPHNSEPCLWLGIQCLDGKVQMLDLGGFSLRGSLAPALRKLRYLRSLVMNNNSLSGSIPKEIGELKLLEVLDLSHNNLSGRIPSEIGAMPSLKCLSLCGNDLHDDFPLAIGKLDNSLETDCNQHIKSFVNGAKNYVQSSGPRSWWLMLNQLKDFFGINYFLETKHAKYLFYADGDSFCCNESIGEVEENARRQLLKETSNLPALPSTKVSHQGTPIDIRSGVYPIFMKKLHVPSETPTSTASNDHPKEKVGLLVKLIIIIIILIIIFGSVWFALIVLRRYTGAKVVRAHDVTLLHRLSKVFVTGVPRLNSAELQTACEDFSNIIKMGLGCLVFKGILSSGVEIAVLSSSIKSSDEWSDWAESEFQRKMDTLSRINHKNFVNLLGHCEEDDPFVRMMVFEYAPNGTLYEHLHVKDMDHLDWANRMRIIMGICYCLEHMHHELNPSVLHPHLRSDAVFLTEDYAAKLGDFSFWGEIFAKLKISKDEESEPSHADQGPTLEDNVYSLGLLLLEIISTKSLDPQVMEYLSNEENYNKVVDPTLQSFKTNELKAICKVIRECLDDDPRKRPTLKNITCKLHEVTKISQDSATSKNSPLWWAELELLESG